MTTFFTPPFSNRSYNTILSYIITLTGILSENIPNMKIKSKSTITCPECGYKKEEEMLTDSFPLVYVCENCLAVLKSSECCIFCSYGTVPCPNVQHSKCC
jgi:hypothetical protein